MTRELSPEELAVLVLQAELNQLPWETVAMHEKAHMGYVTLATYNRMTVVERARVGGMNQSTIRRRLGIERDEPAPRAEYVGTGQELAGSR